MYGVYCMDYQYPVVQVSERRAATRQRRAVCFGQAGALGAGPVGHRCHRAQRVPGLGSPEAPPRALSLPACEWPCLTL